MGKVPDRVIDNLIGADVLIIEANHDERMVNEKGLPHGRWVKSPVGHLNNDAAGKAVVKVIQRRHDSSRPLRVLLAHISKEHNTEARAIRQVSKILKDSAVRLAGLYLTHPDRRSRVIEVDR